jgi:hypothetical protein
MMNIEDINDIIGWLYFNKRKSSISPGIGLIVDALWENLDHLEDQTVIDTIAIIIDLAQRSTQSGELAEVCVECGMVAYNKGLHRKALELLQQALSKYITQLHEYAVVKWLIGCVLLEIPEERLKGLESLKNSIESMDRLSKGRLTGAAESAWYRARRQELEKILIERIQFQIRSTIPELTGSQAWAVERGSVPAADDRQRFRRLIQPEPLRNLRKTRYYASTMQPEAGESRIESEETVSRPLEEVTSIRLTAQVDSGDILLARVTQSAQDRQILEPLTINGQKIVLFPSKKP